MNVKRLIYRCPDWIFSIIVVLAILYLTLVPKPLPDIDIPLFPGADKVVHAIMMMGMMWCIGFDLMRHKSLSTAVVPKARIVIALLCTIVFGGAIEMIQGAMGIGRGEDIYDFLADVIGALMGFIVIVIVWGPLVRWLQDE